MIKISDRANLIKPSLTRALFNKAKEYDNVIDLTLGDPDFAPPPEIQDAAYQSMRDNRIHYSANAGLLKAREMVAINVKRVWDIDCNPNSEIAVTVGGMEGLYLSLLCIVNSGDEVIILAPYYVNYLQMIQLCGGTPVIIDSFNPTRGLVIDEKSIEKRITDKTVAIIINSPNNPTGCCLTKGDLAKIAELARKHNLTVITDEVYHSLIYDGKKHESILQFEDIRDQVILVDSLSKEFSMTGYRIGYVCANSQLVSNIVKVQENVAACAALPSQFALIRAYEGVDNEYIVKSFEKRRNILYDGLSKIANVSCLKPSATFYLFLNIEKTNLNAMDFAYKLLSEKQVAVVPGNAYGESFDKYVRIAFTRDESILSEAVNRITDFVK